MKKILIILILTIFCSLYLFPIRLRVMPTVNSKMLMAVVGVMLYSWEHIKTQKLTIRREAFLPILWGVLFSLISYISVVYNNTTDYVYVTYFASMCTWLGGAYCLIYMIRRFYGRATYDILFGYMAFMCLGQCILAILIDNSPQFAQFVSSIIVQVDLEYFDKAPRLYGIGAAFDTAGIRFSCVLLALAYLIDRTDDNTKKVLYITFMLIITVIGNMISRTTTVGCAIALFYLLLSNMSWLNAYITSKKMLRAISLVVIFFIIIYWGNFLYVNNVAFSQAFDYGFEGFINLFKNGEFSTTSSDMLFHGLSSEDLFPDEIKTWVIGDGYFQNPYNPAYFYAPTDSGYIVFIYYCGLVGLLTFIPIFITSTYGLCKREQNLTFFYVLLLLIQLLVWIKIPTDIFCFYSILLLSDGQKKIAVRY